MKIVLNLKNITLSIVIEQGFQAVKIKLRTE